MSEVRIILGDSRKKLKQFPDGHFNLIMTSPPYADARKTHYSSISPEKFPDFFMSFHDELWRVLADDGSMIINIKDKVIDGVRNRYVWKTIMALNDAGWLSVDDYIWHKPNAMPGYWPNRLRDEWEYCFHLTKKKKFKMYQSEVKKPIGDWAEKRLAKLTGKSAERHNSENQSGFGRDLRKWLDREHVLPGNAVSVAVVGKNIGHPAVYPMGLPQFFVKLFTKENDNVLDPFAGSGTTGLAAISLSRNSVLIDDKEDYIKLMMERFKKEENLLVHILNGEGYKEFNNQKLNLVKENPVFYQRNKSIKAKKKLLTHQ